MGDYDDVWYALFSKNPAHAATREARAGTQTLFVDAEELYRGR